MQARTLHARAPHWIAFWNGQGGHTWVARQEHTDITLVRVTEALLGFAAPRLPVLPMSPGGRPTPPRLEQLDLDLDIAAGRGLEEAVVQSTQIEAVSGWMRGQPAETVAAAIASIREALTAHRDGASVRLRGAMWLVSSATAGSGNGIADSPGSLSGVAGLA